MAVNPGTYNFQKCKGQLTGLSFCGLRTATMLLPINLNGATVAAQAWNKATTRSMRTLALLRQIAVGK